MAVCALIFGLGLALNAASFILFIQVELLNWVGTALELGSLAVWWILGRDEHEWVSADRRRTVAVAAIGGGISLIALFFALVSLRPGGFEVGLAVLGLGVPFLGTGMLVGGVKSFFDLRRNGDTTPGGF